MNIRGIFLTILFGIMVNGCSNPFLPNPPPSIGTPPIPNEPPTVSPAQIILPNTGTGNENMETSGENTLSGSDKFSNILIDDGEFIVTGPPGSTENGDWIFHVRSSREYYYIPYKKDTNGNLVSGEVIYLTGYNGGLRLNVETYYDKYLVYRAGGGDMIYLNVYNLESKESKGFMFGEVLDKRYISMCASSGFGPGEIRVFDMETGKDFDGYPHIMAKRKNKPFFNTCIEKKNEKGQWELHARVLKDGVAPYQEREYTPSEYDDFVLNFTTMSLTNLTTGEILK